MELDKMLQIARDQLKRHELCKSDCSTCIPDELLEYDTTILYILKGVAEVKNYYPLLKPYMNDHQYNSLKQAMEVIELKPKN